jgi:hypothetical protein
MNNEHKSLILATVLLEALKKIEILEIKYSPELLADNQEYQELEEIVAQLKPVFGFL